MITKKHDLYFGVMFFFVRRRTTHPWTRLFSWRMRKASSILVIQSLASFSVNGESRNSCKEPPFSCVWIISMPFTTTKTKQNIFYLSTFELLFFVFLYFFSYLDQQVHWLLLSDRNNLELFEFSILSELALCRTQAP